MRERRYGRLNESEEWETIRRTLSERTNLTQSQLDELGEVEGDSMDLVELVMSLEEKYKIDFRF
jgi:acyl carrier protein